jgi:hypothetical protein
MSENQTPKTYNLRSRLTPASNETPNTPKKKAKAATERKKARTCSIF